VIRLACADVSCLPFAVLDLLVSLATYSGHPLSVIVAYQASDVIAYSFDPDGAGDMR
jgi:hypothetical protein